MSDPNESFNQGLWGTGPTGNTNWDDYQRGKSIRDWNANASSGSSSSSFGLGLGGDSSGTTWPPPPAPVSFGGGTSGGTYGPSYGGYAPLAPWKPGLFTALLFLPVFVVLLPVWACLYPLGALATVGSVSAMSTLLPRLAPALTVTQLQGALLGTGALAIVLVTRAEQALARFRAYRYARYALRLSLFALLGASALLPAYAPGGLLGAWHAFPELARTPRNVIVIAGTALVLHWLTQRELPRGIWHGLLRALRMRADS